MLEVGILGVGNAGNQVAELAKIIRGIDGVAINSSDKDLNTVKNIPSLIIGDEKGAGKDRDIAKAFFKQNAAELIDQEDITLLVESKDILIIAGATGGGTGAGIVPVMTAVLKRKFPNKVIIPAFILPTLKDSLAAQENTIEFLKEIRKIPGITYMVYDNEQYSKLPTSEMMKTVNRQIVEDIYAMQGVYQLSTPFSSIDEKDTLKIITTPGILRISQVDGFKDKDITDDNEIEKMLLRKIQHDTAHVEMQMDGIVKRIGVICNVNDRVNSIFDSTIPMVKSTIGEPVELFEHISVLNENNSVNRVVVMLSGLSTPDDRIEKIDARITEAMAKLNESSESILDSLDTGGIKGLRSNGTKQSADDFDLNSIMDDFM